MKISVSFDLTYERADSTPMIFMLNGHSSGMASLADAAISTTFGTTVLKSFNMATQEADQGLPSSKSMVA
jgi:hypothetical protein